MQTRRGIGCGAHAGYIENMNTREKGARRPLQGAIALVLALSSNAALALGLGDIRVLSRPGQPLLAEIPVVSADPGELEAARVALASPATFARVGLERPSGLVSQLQFAFATDAQGRSVIRVTSPGPVEAPVVSFLIEVDWGRGRLVREYSALVDRPHTATAIEAPQIQAPNLGPSNAIVREPAAPIPVAAAPAGERAAAPAPAAGAAPVPASAPTPAARAAVASAVDGRVTVQAGQTLSQIAVGVAREHGVSLDQAMVALLQGNPQAFIGGNIHRLRSGAELALPDAQALSSLGAAQARALVREQTGQWRQVRQAQPQPAVAQTGATPAAAEARPSSPAAAAAAANGARLEIAPAVAIDGTAKASESGTVAGAEGDMLVSEQLRQAREDLATRDAEIAELRERVAELEKLREQQQALIALKDNEMATAQQGVAQPAERSEGSSAPWIWGGGLLLAAAALLAWLARRRKPSPLPPLVVDDGAAGPFDPPLPPDAAPSPAPGALDADAMIQALRGEPQPAAGQWDQEPVATGHADVAAGSMPAAATAAVDEKADGIAGEPVMVDAGGLPETVSEMPVVEEPVVAEPALAEPAVGEPVAAGPVAETAVFAAPAAEGVAALEPEADAAQVEVAEAQAPVAAGLALDAGQAATPEAGEPFDAFLPPPDERAPLADTAPVLDEVVPETTPWAADGQRQASLKPSPGSRERLELAIAYLDLGDADTARTLLEEVAGSADAGSRQQAMELLARLD